MQEIKLEELTIDLLPKEPFQCFIVCNHTAPTEELLETIISSSVKEIDFCGKFAGAWDVVADKVCVKHENDGSRPSDWCVLTCDDSLDNMINHIALGGLFDIDDDSLKNVIVYDDESLKNFIIKRADQEAKITLEDDRYASEEEQKMSDEELEEVFTKERLAKERVELNCHTNMSRNWHGISLPSFILHNAIRKDLAGVAITDIDSVQAYKDTFDYIKTHKKHNKFFKPIYGIQLEICQELGKEYMDYVTILCKNNNGKKALYKLLGSLTLSDSEDRKISFKDEEANGDRILEFIKNNRDDILVGASCIGNKLIDDVFGEVGLDDALKTPQSFYDLSFYDYIEVAPISVYKSNYFHMWSEKHANPEFEDDEIKTAIKSIINLAKKHNKPIVAVSNAYYCVKEQLLTFNLANNKNLDENVDLSIRTTEEMKYAFDWLNDDALVEEIVVTNTHKIADMCEDFEPFDNIFHMPYIEDAYDKLESRVVKKMTEIYGTNVDRLITYRLETELKLIKDNGFASIYMLAAGICDESRAQGYKYSYRGAIGASLVGYLLGISECNPLPPHTICPNCHRVVWNATVASGYDIESHECRECGHIVKGEGQNIPYQTFMAIDGSRVPDIDLNLDPLFRENIVDVIKKVAPENNVIRAGTVITRSYRKAAEAVSEFAGDDEGVIDNATRENLIRNVKSVAAGQGKHIGGYIIVPKDIDINDVTPLTTVDGEIVTHFDFVNIKDNFYRMDCLEHPAPSALRYMELLGLNLDEIDINDPKIYEMLNKNLGYLGIPELGSHYTSFILEKVKPKKFSDLVKISGFAHGTHVWTANAEDLLKAGVSLHELPACRDDIYNTLHFKYDIDEKSAYTIMENVRKGKGLNKEQMTLLRENDVPEWFIESCNKIMYMFPKAYTIAYIFIALKFAWIKLYKPAYFYAQYFEFSDEEIDISVLTKSKEEINKQMLSLRLGDLEKKDIEPYLIAMEMADRGVKLIDKRESDEPGHFAVNPNNENEVLYIGEC